MTQLTGINPFFIVASLANSVAFYMEGLGFHVRYLGPTDDPYFAIVGRDNVSIMLKEIDPNVKPIPNHNRHEWARWDAYIHTRDPDSLYNEFLSRHVNFRQPLRDDDDGLRGFEVQDAVGYVLFFGKPKK